MLNARDGEIETMMAHEKNGSFSFGVCWGEAARDLYSIKWM